MSTREFPELTRGSLLRDVEEIVVGGYRSVHPDASLPEAYHWLRYEDSDPVGRLVDGVRRLRKRGAKFDAKAVDKACAEASKTGF